MPRGIHHPCASRVLLGERYSEEEKVAEAYRQRKGAEKGDLSEACVRGIPCWCQFHSSSSMLRSSSLPQRENIPAGP